MPSFLAAGAVATAGGGAAWLQAAAMMSALNVNRTRRMGPPMKESAFYVAVAVDAIHACRCGHRPDRSRSSPRAVFRRRSTGDTAHPVRLAHTTVVGGADQQPRSRAGKVLRHGGRP